jgi:hypothetical protein
MTAECQDLKKKNTILNHVLQSISSKSFASNDSEEKLDSMTKALNEAYQQQNDRINQLQFCFYLHTNAQTKKY